MRERNNEAELLSSNLLSSFLYGIKSSDPAPMALVVMVLSAVSLIASYIPAHRATKVDPLVALRDE